MNGILDYIRITLVVAFAFLLYVFATHAVNEAACVALELPGSQVVGKGIIKFLAMCWWR